MLRKCSIITSIAGFMLFMAVFGLVVRNPQHAHQLARPMMASIWCMALGMLGVALCASRSWRAEVRALNKEQ